MTSRQFGKLLCTLRKGAGISQKGLAASCYVSQSYVSLIERGQRNPPDAPTIKRIATTLQLTQSQAQSLLAAARLAESNQTLLQNTTDDNPALREVLAMFKSTLDLNPNEHALVFRDLSALIKAWRTLARVRYHIAQHDTDEALRLVKELYADVSLGSELLRTIRYLHAYLQREDSTNIDTPVESRSTHT